MPIGGIHHSNDNPFLKKNLDDLSLNKSNSSINVDGGNSPAKVDKPTDVNKINNDKGASNHNLNNHNDSIINRSNFTNESELQEIDLKDFEDDM